MTYKETVNYLYEQLPAFQQQGKAAVNWKLEKIQRMCHILGNPHEKFKSIHVAGTNGKGSSSHFIASILQEAGYNVGLYTSPHLKDFRERFRINGQLVHKNFVIGFVKRHKELIKEVKPSFFEITVAMAFELFAKKKVDYAVIEVGLGGRLDSTNIISPMACLITNIGFDHMDMLGDTLPKIASEKAGIIKAGIPVVISERHLETENVFKEKAELLSSPIFFAQDFYAINNVSEGQTKYIVYNKEENTSIQIDSQLTGSYQSHNILGVLKLLDLLRKQGIQVGNTQMLNGLANVIDNTNLKGRWQHLDKEPVTICDTGHNIHAFVYLLNHIKEGKFKHYHLILGFAKDKDPSELLDNLPQNVTVYFCSFNSPRAMLDYSDYRQVKNINIHDSIFSNVNVALQEVKKNAEAEDFIFVGGSTYLVAELDEL